MPDSRVHIRRARRTDFTAVMQLLAAAGMPLPPPDRRTVRRFRHLVADLGVDFYLALVDGAVAGLVHVSYARQLAHAPRAQLERLLVAAALRRTGVGGALLAFAAERARRRGCAVLMCTVPHETGPALRFLQRAGWRRMGEWLAMTFPDEAMHG